MPIASFFRRLCLPWGRRGLSLPQAGSLLHKPHLPMPTAWLPPPASEWFRSGAAPVVGKTHGRAQERVPPPRGFQGGFLEVASELRTRRCENELAKGRLGGLGGEASDS